MEISPLGAKILTALTYYLEVSNCFEKFVVSNISNNNFELTEIIEEEDFFGNRNEVSLSFYFLDKGNAYYLKIDALDNTLSFEDGISQLKLMEGFVNQILKNVNDKPLYLKIPQNLSFFPFDDENILKLDGVIIGEVLFIINSFMLEDNLIKENVALNDICNRLKKERNFFSNFVFNPYSLEIMKEFQGFYIKDGINFEGKFRLSEKDCFEYTLAIQGFSTNKWLKIDFDNLEIINEEHFFSETLSLFGEDFLLEYARCFYEYNKLKLSKDHQIELIKLIFKENCLDITESNLNKLAIVKKVTIENIDFIKLVEFEKLFISIKNESFILGEKETVLNSVI